MNMIHPKPDHLAYLLILGAKQYIYRCRCMKMSMDLNTFVREFEHLQIVEWYTAKMKNRITKHYKKWKPLLGTILVDEQTGLVDDNYVNGYKLNISV